MAKSLEEILGKPIGSVKELRNEINSLRDSLVGLDKESSQYAATEQKLAAAQSELNNVTRAGKDIYVGATDSIKGMEAEYRKLYTTYSQMTEAERSSAFGKETAAQLKTLSEKLNETKQGVGNFKDNIGHYAEAIQKVFKGAGVSIGGLKGPLGIATTGMKGFNAVVKANPIGMLITLIMGLVGIFQKMRDAVAANEEKQMKLNEIMSRFQPIIDAVKNGLDALADTFLKIVDWATKAATAVRRFFASDKEAFDAEQKQYQELAKAQNELTKQKRINKELNAKDNAAVKALEEEASATDNAAQKQKLLTEAKEKQAEIDQRKIAEAEETLRILEEEAALTANDAEANERLAEAKAAVADATAQADANAKRFNRQIQAATRSMRSAAGSAKNLREEAKKLFEQNEEETKSELQKLDEKYKKEYELLKKYGYDTTTLTANYSKQRQIIIKNEIKKEEDDRRDSYERQTAFMKRIQEINLKNLTEGSAAYAEEQLKVALETVEKFKPIAEKFLSDYEQRFTGLLGKWVWDRNMGGGLEKAKTEMEKLVAVLRTPEIEEGFNIKFPKEWTRDTIKVFKDQIEGLLVSLQIDLDKFWATFEKRFKEESKGIDALIAERTGSISSYMKSFIENPDKIDYNAIYEEDAKYQVKILELRKEVLEELLRSTRVTGEVRIEIEKEYYDVVEKLTEKKIALEELSAERTASVWDAAWDSIENVTSSINNLISTYSSLMQAELQEGKISQQEYNKKVKQLKNLAAIQLGVSIANITASNAAAIMDVWRGYAAELPVNAETAAASGPAAAITKAALDAKSLTAAILRTVGIGANATAQLAAATGQYISTTNSLTEGSVGGTASVASVATIDSAPFTYTRTLQTAEEQDALNRPIYVSVVDIEDKLNAQKVKVTETHF